METEGKSYSDMFRNTSEEMFLKTVMDSSLSLASPTMEILGFKNFSQNFRVDSEELFKTWLTNGENSGFGSGTGGHRPRNLSRRVLNEATISLTGRQNGNVHSDVPDDTNHHHQLRNVADKGLQGSNLYLAKAWFHSSQPMTRSRSSELRRKYIAMQNTQSYIGMEAAQNPSAQSVMKQEMSNEMQQDHFSPSLMPYFDNNNFKDTQYEDVDQVSSLVNMLKGTLENKRGNNSLENTHVLEDISDCFQFSQNDVSNQDMSYLQGNKFHETHMTATYSEAHDMIRIQAAEGHYEEGLETFISPLKQNQMNASSHEPCQSESSAAAPVVSSRFDICDGPSNSSQTICVSDNSRKDVGKSTSPENGVKTKDFREHIYESSKDIKKRGSLVRYGSVTSTVSGDHRGDPTKKRRVERSRKMAEAKERNSTPAVPSDMQSILKRCENLEKEVRSLKLNLSFMNRKDSEQTKQIEELQVQNEELGEEKERLLEEIERIISDSGRI